MYRFVMPVVKSVTARFRALIVGVSLPIIVADEKIGPGSRRGPVGLRYVVEHETKFGILGPVGGWT